MKLKLKARVAALEKAMLRSRRRRAHTYRCKAWPKCPCVVQGYRNDAEPSGCGKFPRV